MKKYLALTLFLFAEISVLAFILITATDLPETVASHFNAAGVPNGFMPRKFYILFMLIFTVGVPSLISGSIALVTRFPESRINLPNKALWLSEKHRVATFSYLQSHALVMGTFIAIFMAYVHWLVIKANSVMPAQLSSEAILSGLVVFFVALVGWSIMLPLKFMRPPKA